MTLYDTLRVIMVYDTYCEVHNNKENEKKNKNIKFKSWSSFFNLC